MPITTVTSIRRSKDVPNWVGFSRLLSMARAMQPKLCRQIAAWGDAHFAGKETSAMIAPENTASIRVAEKIGFVRKLETTYKGEPTLVFYRAPKS